MDQDKQLDGAIKRIQRMETLESIESIYDSGDTLYCMELYSRDRSFVVKKLIASHETGERYTNELLAKIEELTAKNEQLEKDCLEEIANRELAEGQLDRIASKVLGEAIDWPDHYSKWCEAEDEATRLAAERNHFRAERDLLEARVDELDKQLTEMRIEKNMIALERNANAQGQRDYHAQLDKYVKLSQDLARRLDSREKMIESMRYPKPEHVDLVRLACEKAVKRFGDRADGMFNGAGFSIEFRKLAGTESGIDGKIVYAILSSRSDVQVKSGGSHYLLIPGCDT